MDSPRTVAAVSGHFSLHLADWHRQTNRTRHRMAREEIVNTLTQSVLLEQSVLHPTLVIDSEF